MAEWREPEWARGHCSLKEKDWPRWRDHYRKGNPLPCPMCGHQESVDLSPVRHVIVHGCGHIMELPARTDL